MATDIFKIFKSCFYCHSKKDLLRVEHPGYDTTFNYYHKECLKEVLLDPEKHVGCLDTAISIQDQIIKDDEQLKKQQRYRQELINRAKELSIHVQPEPVIEVQIIEQQESESDQTKFDCMNP
jgi:hypothetical protein